MSTFKQKLKNILNDTLAFYVPRTAEEQLEFSILTTRKKIKNDNNKHLFRTKSSTQINHNKYDSNFINDYKYQAKENKQPNQINSLFMTKTKFYDSSNSLINNENDYFYTINQYGICSTRVNPKIQRDINTFKKENSLISNKKMICNRPISNLNNILCNFDKNNYSSFNKKQFLNTKKHNSCIKITNNDFSSLRNNKKRYIFEYTKKENDSLFGKNDKNYFYRNKNNNSYRTFTTDFLK